MESTDELRGDLSMLDQNARAAGVGLGTTREAMQKLNTVSGETDSSIEQYQTSWPLVCRRTGFKRRWRGWQTRLSPSRIL